MIPVPAVTTDWDRFFYCIRPAPEKKEAKKFEEDFNAYKKQMMTNSTFISGLYEAFKSFNLNTDCIDSLVEHYVKTK